MHIETLKTFCDLVESGSFTRAARMNMVSQSAVSQQLKTLETRYGCQLLERDRRSRLVLTDHGRQLYAGCRELLERFRLVETQLRDRSTTISGTIRVATVYSVGLHALPPYITRFMKQYPQVKVHLEYRRTDKVCEGCLDDSLDVGIVALPVRTAHLTLIPWQEEPLVLVCGAEHRLARRGSVNLAQLQGEEFIAFERDIPTRKTIDRILARHRVRVNRVMEFDNVETIKRAVQVGSGLSILPQSTVEGELKRRVLVRVGIADGRFARTVAVVHRRGRALSGATRAFLALLDARAPNQEHAGTERR